MCRASSPLDMQGHIDTAFLVDDQPQCLFNIKPSPIALLLLKIPAPTAFSIILFSTDPIASIAETQHSTAEHSKPWRMKTLPSATPIR